MSDEQLDLLHKRAVLLAALARDEDLGTGDITSALCGDVSGIVVHLVARQRGVLAGHLIAGDLLGVYGDTIELIWSDRIVDGTQIGPDAGPIATLRGPVRAVLAAERVFLNFLQRLCGVATLTRAYVDAVAGTGAEIFDTRKTTPGWRLLDKYAVRCGGGRNHRMGLHDAVLIKDNHLAGVPTERLASHVFSMLNAVSRLKQAPSFVEVEADSVAQAAELFKVTGIDVVLLDNFSADQLCEVIELRDGVGLSNKVALEASGGITMDTVRAVAETGVDRISVGAITHSAPALDLALDREERDEG